jgi:hypothetical protein
MVHRFSESPVEQMKIVSLMLFEVSALWHLRKVHSALGPDVNLRDIHIYRIQSALSHLSI